MASLVRGWRGSDRLAAAYLLADPMFALAAARFHLDDPPEKRETYRPYFFTAAWTCWAGWLLLTGAGILLGNRLPETLPLEAATPLTFLLLLLPTLDDATTQVAALVGGLTAALFSGLPPSGLDCSSAQAPASPQADWPPRSRTPKPSPRRRTRMPDLFVITCVGLGTFAFRALFLVTPRESSQTRGATTLALVAPAVLAAITVPAVLAPRGVSSLAESLPSLAAAAISFLVWRRTRGFRLALMAGLGSWWVFLAIIPGR